MVLGFGQAAKRQRSPSGQEVLGQVKRSRFHFKNLDPVADECMYGSDHPLKVNHKYASPRAVHTPTNRFYMQRARTSRSKTNQ